MCGKESETLGQLLSSCTALQWTLYKTEHDRILYQVVLMLSDVYKITFPESRRWTLTGWSGTGVCDLYASRDRALTKCRPDLIALFSENRRMAIFEVACIWDPLMHEREEQRRRKYQELATDLVVARGDSLVYPIHLAGTVG